MKYFYENSEELETRGIITDLGFSLKEETLRMVEAFALDNKKHPYHKFYAAQDPGAFGFFKGLKDKNTELYNLICEELGEIAEHVITASVSVVKKESVFWYHKDNGRNLILYVPLLNISPNYRPFQCIFNNEIHTMNFKNTNFVLMETSTIHGVNNLENPYDRFTFQMNLSSLSRDYALEIIQKSKRQS